MSATALLAFPLLVGYAVAIGLTAGLAGYCLLRQSTRVAHAFGAYLIAVLVWSLGAVGRLFAATETSWYAWTLVTYLGSVSTAVLLVVFAVLYTDWGPFPTPGRVALLFVVPATSLLLLSTDPAHELFFAAVAETAFGDLTLFTTERGPWFWVNTLYSYVLLGAATALLAGFAINNHRVYRRQAVSVLGGVSVPWLVNGAYLLYAGDGLGLPVDPTPAGFAAGSGLLAYAVIGAGLTDLTPIARSAVIDAMDDAVFVLDGDGRVVDYNPVAETLLEVEDPIGRPVRGVLPGSLPAADVASDSDPAPVTVGDADRWYQARKLPLADEGSVLLVSDLTEQVRRRRQLREQNERLEEFTHVAAHDLRNPLNAISGYTELALKTGDASHLEQVDPAIRRIETLVDDLLTLGREGRVVEETDPVSLTAAAEAAWENVDTGSATLETAADRRILAGEARLTQLLEHLFTNAVSHGGEDVAVRVGLLPDGFFVADDGSGIPTASRADVFEYGYSTHGGTGLGLPVVRSIAVAHGWDVSVIDGAGGGARFDFTGVEARTDHVSRAARSDRAPGRSPE